MGKFNIQYDIDLWKNSMNKFDLLMMQGCNLSEFSSIMFYFLFLMTIKKYQRKNITL